MGLWHVVATFQALFTKNTDVPALLEQGNPAAFSEELCRLSEAPNVPHSSKNEAGSFLPVLCAVQVEEIPRSNHFLDNCSSVLFSDPSKLYLGHFVKRPFLPLFSWILEL